MILATVTALLLAAAPPSTPVPAVAASAEAAAPVQVLVLEPSSSSLDGPTRKTVSNLLVVELGLQRGLRVIGANEVQMLTALEGDKQAAGCTESACLSELAGALGARYVIFGDVGPLGSRQVLNLNLFDAQQATAINRTAITFQNVEELPGLLPAPLKALTAPLLQTTTSPNVDAPAVTAPAAPSPLLPVGLIVAGGVVTVVGVAFDLWSPTSDDGALDARDALGPAGMVVGVGLAATGVVMLVFGGGHED